jgi:hypothetical protein
MQINKEPAKDYYKPPTYQFFKIIFIGILITTIENKK